MTRWFDKELNEKDEIKPVRRMAKFLKREKNSNVNWLKTPEMDLGRYLRKTEEKKIRRISLEQKA